MVCFKKRQVGVEDDLLSGEPIGWMTYENIDTSGVFLNQKPANIGL